MSFSQKEAAEALGLKRRVVQYYEKGERGGAKVKIPKTVRLACAALSHGLADYQGPEKPAEGKTGSKRPSAKKGSDKGKT
ncbi:MAG TPA: XRE family transcriptional regulator, partial [Kiloniellales bacterium]|nr:XRE family transcriptional regulator [Kiloniellales bacterium]